MTYTIHRYPAELAEVVHVKGGERIAVRPVLPQDAGAMQDFFRGLSDASRRNRFFRAIRELPRALIDRFTNVDYHSHFALMATALAHGQEVIVGEARYVLIDAGEAEFAIAVADQWQGKGLGRVLLTQLLRRAAAEGVETIFGETLPTNQIMQSLARKLGFTARWSPQGSGIVRVTLRIDGPVAGLPCFGGDALSAQLVASRSIA